MMYNSKQGSRKLTMTKDNMDKWDMVISLLEKLYKELDRCDGKVSHQSRAKSGARKIKKHQK